MFKFATKLRPTRESLGRARQVGFRAAELWTNSTSLQESREIAAVSREVDLDYAIHFPNKGSLQAAHLEGASALYRDLNCRAMVIHEPMWRLYGKALIEIEPTLRLGVENHRLDKRAFHAWADGHQWLTLDVEHLWLFTLSGESLSALEKALGRFLDTYAEKLVHVHLPGCLPGREEHRPMYCSRDMVFMALSQLNEAGFEGLVVSEVELEFQNELELEMDVLLFKRWKQLTEIHSPTAAEVSTN